MREQRLNPGVLNGYPTMARMLLPRTASTAGLAVALSCSLSAGGDIAASEDARAEQGANPLETLQRIAAGASNDDPMDALLESFASDDFVRREAASATLIKLNPPDEVIVGALRTRTLAPEQRERLIGILRERFLDGDRPALGIQMQPQPMGILIVNVVHNGFPAAETLRGDDLILTLGGVDFRARPNLDELRRTILSFEPGDTVPLRIRRNNAELDMFVRLGRFASLNAPGTLHPADLIGAWEVRARRLGLLRPEGEPIGVSTRALRVRSETRPNANPLTVATQRTARTGRSRFHQEWIVAGGAPAGSIERRLEGLVNVVGTTRPDVAVRFEANDGRAVVEMRNIQPRDAERDPGGFRALVERVDEIEARLRTDRIVLADPELNDAVREQIEQRVRSQEELLKHLKNLVEAMSR